MSQRSHPYPAIGPFLNRQAVAVVDASNDRPSARKLIDELGVEEAGRHYVSRADQWDALALVVFDRTDDGEELPLDLWWDILMAALEACPEDDDSPWLLGDGPFDHMRERPGVDERLMEERKRNPKVERLFVAMQRELPSEDTTS